MQNGAGISQFVREIVKATCQKSQERGSLIDSDTMGSVKVMEGIKYDHSFEPSSFFGGGGLNKDLFSAIFQIKLHLMHLDGWFIL